MKTNIFEYKSYRKFVSESLGEAGRRTGLRQKAAKFINCNPAYLTQVLKENAHLSQEQAYLISEFLKLDSQEQKYFINLVHKERAAIADLKTYYENELQKIKDDRLDIKSRIKNYHRLNAKDENTYYSSWLYSASHVLISIPHLQTKQALTDFLKVPFRKVSEVLDFLTRTNLALENRGIYKIGTTHLHLSDDSVHIKKHHSNWRNYTIQNLEFKKKTDLHYSAIITLSKTDAAKIREKLLEQLKEHLATISQSKEDTAYVYCLDFFGIEHE